MIHGLTDLSGAILNKFWRYKKIRFSLQAKGISCFSTYPHQRASQWRLRDSVFSNYQENIQEQEYALVLSKSSGKCFLWSNDLFKFRLNTWTCLMVQGFMLLKWYKHKNNLSMCTCSLAEKSKPNIDLGHHSQKKGHWVKEFIALNT